MRHRRRLSPNDPPERLTRFRPAEDYPGRTLWEAYAVWRREVNAWADAHDGEVGHIDAVGVYVLLRQAHERVPRPPKAGP